MLTVERLLGHGAQHVVPQQHGQAGPAAPRVPRHSAHVPQEQAVLAEHGVSGVRAARVAFRHEPYLRRG